mmetsp:Transcript_6873/g.9775  ORF Transcript_6873/g.9775 Transcript_6873/m.9775 type:complete len:94 (-) Transcript_6873:72-353(-)
MVTITAKWNLSLIVVISGMEYLLCGDCNGMASAHDGGSRQINGCQRGTRMVISAECNHLIEAKCDQYLMGGDDRSRLESGGQRGTWMMVISAE